MKPHNKQDLNLLLNSNIHYNESNGHDSVIQKIFKFCNNDIYIYGRQIHCHMLDTHIIITFTADFNGEPVPLYRDRQNLNNTLPFHVRQFDCVSL
jgi:hypothetical protein